MARDIQFDILDRVRHADIRETCRLGLSERSARRLLDGFAMIRSDLNTPDQVENYEGAGDDFGVLTFLLDESLTGSVGRVFSDSAPDGVSVSLAGIV